MLPPTVVGYLLLRVLGPKRLIGAWVLEVFGIRLVMTWWSAIFATAVVIFPLMYRTVRGAFEAFDETLAYAGQTLGLSIPTFLAHPYALLPPRRSGRCGNGYGILVRRPATQSAARLTGCRSFLSARAVRAACAWTAGTSPCPIHRR